MKFGKTLVALIGLALLLPLSALAAKNQTNISISQAVQVGATQLQPGDYKVQWEGDASAVKVTILQGRKTVATSSGKLVDRDQPAHYNAVVLKPGTGDTKVIDEINFANQKQVLVLTDNSTQSGQ